MRRALASVPVALALLVPTAASAATAKVEEYRDYDVYYVASYDAAPGEVNDLTVASAGDAVVLTDSGAEITPGDGCTPITVHSVTCTHEGGISSVEAALGDEEDHFTSEGPHFRVEGGPGNDDLEAGEGGGILSGDGGDDMLRGAKLVTFFDGGDGADTMIGSDQDDRFTGGPGPDTIDGRGQFDAEWSRGDLVSYADHDAPVTVDLSDPGATVPGGAVGEGDTLTNIESATGGKGDDRLSATQVPSSTGIGSELDGLGGHDVVLGGPGSDNLDGGGGDDSVRGGGADDHVAGGPGHDTLAGGGGSNELWSFDLPTPERDSVGCGDGGSVYAGSAAEPLRDVIDQSCERVDLWGPVVGRVAYKYVGRPTRAVSSTVTCARHCGVTVGLRAHGKVIGSATREIRGVAGGNATLTVPLTRAARVELARTGRLKVGFSMDVRWGARLRHPQATSWQLMLHDPPAR